MYNHQGKLSHTMRPKEREMRGAICAVTALLRGKVFWYKSFSGGPKFPHHKLYLWDIDFKLLIKKSKNKKLLTHPLICLKELR